MQLTTFIYRGTDCWFASSIFSFLIALGTVLATLCWDGVEMLEKESRIIQSLLKAKRGFVDSLLTSEKYSPFSAPIQVLYLLLTRNRLNGSRYCHRRSGKYYERLCIDLEQNGMWPTALRECTNAIRDPFVKVSFSRC